MNTELKNKFMHHWKKYFKNAELPVTFYYSDEVTAEIIVPPAKKWNCLICEMKKVRKGEDLIFNAEALGCQGAKRYLGYSEKLRPGFEFFLSYGNEKVEGERYKRNPELVQEMMKHQVQLPVNRKNIVFKRWDKLNEADNPDVVIFFAKPDVLAGLFTLANFDQSEPDGVYAPFGAGCGSIVHYPYLEKKSVRPRAVIGMFDPSARPCVPYDTLSFSVPMEKFEKMISYMEESFLITKTWTNMMKRLE